MESKKAQEILQSGACHVCDAELMDGHRIGCDDLAYYVTAEEAIEQAEADRDAKAVEAHRTSCESFYHGGCCGPHEPCTAECIYMKKFIQKLNNEE